MTTYAAALAYRGLFGLFPLIILMIALLAVLRFVAVFEMLLEQAESEPPRQVPGPLEPVIEQEREQLEPLRKLVERAWEEAGSGLLSFGGAVAPWSTHALARTIIQALNAAYEVLETRPG